MGHQAEKQQIVEVQTEQKQQDGDSENAGCRWTTPRVCIAQMEKGTSSAHLL